ncbi:MAG TPA: M20/M25/M40 family metallo-hydrolase [Candidatus Dormibacteraeota bacterium]|nr:M20/M25/M40 family metallo-hydrolase [Candidatus Dormibacteraeota bacterium]
MATTQSLVDSAVDRARSRQKADLDDLIEELRIPSISTLSERFDDCVRNARWLQARFEAMGMKTQLVEAISGHLPVLVAESTPIPGKPHLTIYGHYDVQPVDPIDEWKSPPFEAAVREGEVWARGAADNKGNHMVTVKAAEHLVAAGGLPINLRFIIEGEEEITGPAVTRYLRDNGSHLKTDTVLVWDSGMDEEGNPTLATALRGILYTELRAKGPAVDLHSGVFGGVAPNPINTLARIIGEIKDRNGHVTIPGFYDAVRQPTAEETAAWRKKDASYAETVQRMSGVKVLEGEPEFLTLERAGSRPTLDANGFVGGFTGKGAKTVIPAEASAKVSMRLVPDQDPKTILASYQKYVRELSTPGVEISVEVIGSAPPVTCGVDNFAARTLRAAYKEAFGKDTVPIRVGGSIPVAVDFQEAVGGELVISGVTQADCAIHSPNEHFVIDNYHRGIEAVIRFICGLAGGG